MNPFDLMGEFSQGFSGNGAMLVLLAVPTTIALLRNLHRGVREAAKAVGMAAAMMVVGWMLCSAFILLPVTMVAEFFHRMPAGELQHKRERAQAEIDGARHLLNSSPPESADAKRLARFYEGKSKAAEVLDKAQKRLDSFATWQPMPGLVQAGALALTFLTPFALFMWGVLSPPLRLPAVPGKAGEKPPGRKPLP